MRTVSARSFGLFCGVVGVLATGSADAATYSLQAVKLNGSNIKTCSGSPANVACTDNAGCPVGQHCRGRNSLDVAPGNEVTADVFVSGWGAEVPDGVRTFQVKLLGVAGFGSGDNGTILPNGWVGPFVQDLNEVGCGVDGECVADPRYADCRPPFGCFGATHNPASGISMDRNRPDFLLYQFDGTFAFDTSNLDYRFVGVSDAFFMQDPGFPLYCGTVTMRASANACGVFTVGINASQSYIQGGPSTPNPVFPEPQSLVMNVTPCVRQLLSCGGDPPHTLPIHGMIDARAAVDRAGLRPPFNWRTFSMHFSAPTAGMGPPSFQVSQIPSVGVQPSVSTVVPSGSDATVTLNQPINQAVWTCIKDVLSGKRCCFGSLPGDATGPLTETSSTVGNPADIFELRDNLQDFVVPRLTLEKCDTDRSALCLPADVLTAVDLLNGAGAYPDPPLPQANTLPAKPSMVVR